MIWVEDRIAVGLREEGPFSRVDYRTLRKRGSSLLGEVRFDLFVRDAGTWIVQRFLHLSAEPRIMSGGVIG